MDYKEILQSAGYPTDILCLDFETYFDTEYGLGKMSTIEYINDSRFELTGVGWLWPDSDKTHFEGGYKWTNEAVNAMWTNWGDEATWVVQNAKFDITILQTKFGIVPKYIIDLKDLACHYDSQMSHKLKDVAKMFGLKPKGDTQQFKGLHWDDATEEQHKNLAEYCINDVELETELFKILLPKLSNPAFELQLMRHTLDLWLHKRFAIDMKLATSLKMKMRSKMAQTVKDSGYTVKELRSQKFVKFLQEVLPEGENVPMKQGKRGNIMAMAKNDEACQELLVHPKKEVRDLVLARLSVKSWPTHIKRVEGIVAQAKANGGLLRVPLQYYAGHTGRYGGSEGINLQNFGGRGRAGSGIDPLIGEVRKLLCTPDINFVLGIGDSAQIEARMLAWLAGQQDLLDGFARGEDVYSVFATTLFRSPVRKARKTDPVSIAKMLDIRRGFGKDAVLGCGYGMGSAKFYSRCIQNPSLRPLFDSGQYDYGFIEKLIKTYRTTYPLIPAYWNDVERAFSRCIRFPHLQPEVGPVQFSCLEGTVHVRLPSGRILYYRHAQMSKKGIKYHHGPLWGGSITENIDQAISRDLLGYWILKCEENNLKILLTVHDEIVILVDVMKQDEQMKLFESILCTVPDWAKGLPVAAEVKVSENYSK